jgi:hypothetical protein
LIGSNSEDAPNGFTEANGGLPDDDPIALREDELLGNDEATFKVALLLSTLALNAVVLCDFTDDPKLKAAIAVPAVDVVLGTSALDEGSAGKAVTENRPVLSDVALLNDDDDDALKVKGLLPELCESDAPKTNGFELDELLGAAAAAGGGGSPEVADKLTALY